MTTNVQMEQLVSAHNIILDRFRQCFRILWFWIDNCSQNYGINSTRCASCSPPNFHMIDISLLSRLTWTLKLESMAFGWDRRTFRL